MEALENLQLLLSSTNFKAIIFKIQQNRSDLARKTTLKHQTLDL